MYRHLLVPIDGSELSTATVTEAVTFARSVDARVTFFHARPDYGATQEGALSRSITPELFAEKAAGEAQAFLAKAEAAARAAGVRCGSIARTSDRPYEAIIETAEAEACDLIFMASHGRRGLRGLMLGSQTQKVLMHTRIPVLVAAVESNLPDSDSKTAMTIIEDEHRSLAAVVHGLQHLLREAREGGQAPDFALLRGMLGYIKAFPETLHHPKEDAYLFRLLHERTRAFDEVLGELRSQHYHGARVVTELEEALDRFEQGAADGLEGMAAAVERFAQAQWAHMRLEEKVIFPAALDHLMASDWAEIAAAFGENGDPRFGAEPDEGYRKMFARIMNMAARSGA